VTFLRLASLLFGLVMACALMLCGAAIAFVVHWVPSLVWPAALCFWLAAWGLHR